MIDKQDVSSFAGAGNKEGMVMFIGEEVHQTDLKGNTGELQAYDATTGTRLWSFQTGAGANNTATIFQQNGKQVTSRLAVG